MSPSKDNATGTLIEHWTLPPDVTLGSVVRAKGILRELRARLPPALRKSLDIKGSVLTLSLPEDAAADFQSALAVVASKLQGIEDLPVIPREIEDILAISTTERHRWLKDGRLQSAGTRTVKLRGRARRVTFHVFDPRHVEDLLNRDMVDTWREDDAIRTVENRRLAAANRALKRSAKKGPAATPALDETPEEAARHKLKGWAEFERDGLLR